MSEDFIQLPPDGSGKKVRAVKRTVGDNEVYEEAHVIVDPSTGNLITPLKEGGNVNVSNMPSDYLKEDGNVNIANLPSNYPLPSSQISDLKDVNVGNMPTDYARENQLPSSLSSGGNLKVSVQEDNVGLLKEGGNVNIGNLPSEYPLPSSQVNSLKTVNVSNMPTDYLKENGDVNVNNMPTDYVRNSQLPSSLTGSGNLKVALNEDNLNLLKEGGNVNIGNLPSEYPLPSSQVSNLKNVTVNNMPADYLKEDGNVNIGNFPSTYPLPSSQITDLKNVNVGNFPSDYPDSGANMKLNNIYGKLNSQLDVTLTVLSKLMRYGRNISPSWVHGNEITAPSANTSLVSHTVSSGKQGLIYGFYISSDEENVFRIEWVSGGVTKSIRVKFGGGGTIHYVDFFAMNEGQPADSETEIKIVNVNDGSSGMVYQARLFIAEV